jgi:hypothetical protein
LLADWSSAESARQSGPRRPRIRQRQPSVLSRSRAPR